MTFSGELCASHVGWFTDQSRPYRSFVECDETGVARPSEHPFRLTRHQADVAFLDGQPTDQSRLLSRILSGAEPVLDR
jgi:hypothetical protein